MSEKKGCSESVYDALGWKFYPCSKPPKVVRDGKPYCKIHDPEYVAEKHRKRIDKYDAEAAADRERQRKVDGYDALAARVEELEGENAKLRLRYEELIFAVGHKFPEETRHETALRYIVEAERHDDGVADIYAHNVRS